MTRITAAQLRAVAPRARADIIDGILAHQGLIFDAGVTTPLRLSHFFGQMAVESAGFTTLEESLYYTSAERIRSVWPTRFKTLAQAKPYVRNPRELANKVYGGRMGNTGPDHGWDYRGSGLMQTTGKANFLEVQRASGLQVVTDPDILRGMPGALQAALIFWSKRGLNALADRDDVEGVTRKINGGTHALAERRAATAKAKRAFADVDQDMEPRPVPLVDQGELVARPGPAVDPVTPPPAASQVVTPASAESLIRQLQQALNARYYPAGAADGNWGKLTRDAVMSFNADHGLPIGQGEEIDLLAVMAAEPRVIESREDAKVKDLKGRDIPSVLSAFRARAAGMWLALLSFLGLGGDQLSNVDGVASSWDRFKSYVPLLGDLAGVFKWLLAHWYIPVGVAGIGTAVWGFRTLAKRLAEFKAGRVK